MTRPSLPTLLIVYAALIALWLATYGVAMLPLEAPWHLLAALGIAITKTLLIATFFMHLAYSGPLNRVAACAGFFWLAIMIGLAMCDYLTRVG